MINLKYYALIAGVTTLTSLTTIPAINSSINNGSAISANEPIGIYASYDEDEEDKSYSDARKYTANRDDIYDSENYDKMKDVDKHLNDETPDAFSDPAIRECAERYSNQGYLDFSEITIYSLKTNYLPKINY
ncbi:MAG: hypothetical protein IJ065_02120 [Eubacterium sp.]|nr:hypothetical protein [Eubacterium sp.]